MDSKNNSFFEVIVKEEFSSSIESSWKQYRILYDKKEDVYLFLNNNGDCVHKEKREILTSSDNYMITQDEDDVIEMHGSEFPMKEDIVFRFAIDKKELHYSHDALILDTERGLRILICASNNKGYGNITKKINLYCVENSTLKRDEDFHMATQKTYAINSVGAGCRGFYCKGSFRPYYKEKSVKTDLGISPIKVETTGIDGIDVLVTQDGNTKLVDSKTMKVIASYESYRMVMNKMLITKNAIYDIRTRKPLFNYQDGSILFLTEKGTEPGYFVWVAKNV